MEGSGLRIKGKMGGIGICGRVGKRGKKGGKRGGKKGGKGGKGRKRGKKGGKKGGCKISPTYRVKYREISNARCETTKCIWMRRMISHA